MTLSMLLKFIGVRMKIVDKVKFLSIRAIFLLLAIFIFTVFINLSWFDENLRAEIQALQTPQPVSLDNNGYPLLFGLASADDKDPFTVGQTIIEAQRVLYAQKKKIELNAEQLENIVGGTGLDNEWQESYKSLSCLSRISLNNCAEKLAEEIQRSGIDHPRLQILLSRYEVIQQQKRFRENEEWDAYSPIPPYTLLMQVSRIHLASTLNQPDNQMFLDFVTKDLLFWKTMLSDGQLLIAKMVALAGIRNDLDNISFAIRTGRLNNTELDSISKFLLPLTLEERNIGETFLAEFRVSILNNESLEHTYGGLSVFEKLLWQRNATVNADYLTFAEPLQNLSSLTANDFYLQEGFTKLTFSVPTLPSSLYNLSGKMSLRDARANYNLQDYITRVHDLNTMISVVLLQAELALNPGGSIQEFVDNSEYINPYTLTPMVYDGISGTVGIDCLSSNESDLCKVLL